MKINKQTLIDWMVEDEGKTIARITKSNGFYMVYIRNALSGKMEHFMNCLSFKEAKHYAMF